MSTAAAPDFGETWKLPSLVASPFERRTLEDDRGPHGEEDAAQRKQSHRSGDTTTDAANGSGAHWRGERTGIQWSRGSAEWLRTCGRRGTVGVPVAASIVRGGTQEDGE